MAYCNKIIIILFCAILIFLFFPITAVKAVSGTDFYNLPPSSISDEIKNAICKLEPFYSKTDGRFTYDFIVNIQQNDAQYSIIFILRDTVKNFENKMPLVNYFDESYPNYWYQVLFSSDENTQYNYIQYFYDISSQTITGGSSVTSNQIGNNSIVTTSESIPFWSSVDLYKGSTGVTWNYGITDATRQQLIDSVFRFWEWLTW